MHKGQTPTRHPQGAPASQHYYTPSAVHETFFKHNLRQQKRSPNAAESYREDAKNTSKTPKI